MKIAVLFWNISSVNAKNNSSCKNYSLNFFLFFKKLPGIRKATCWKCVFKRKEKECILRILVNYLGITLFGNFFPLNKSETYICTLSRVVIINCVFGGGSWPWRFWWIFCALCQWQTAVWRLPPHQSFKSSLSTGKTFCLLKIKACCYRLQ